MSQLYCRILSLHAYHNSENDGDEVFLKVNQNKIWPADEKYVSITDNTERINHLLKIDNVMQAIEVELFEYDSFLFSKKLGVFILNPNNTGGPFRTDLTLKSSEYARYSLEWEVVAK